MQKNKLREHFLSLPSAFGRVTLLRTEIGLAEMFMIFLSYFRVLLGDEFFDKIFLTKIFDENFSDELF